MPARKKSAAPKDTTAHLGFEAKLWLAADTAARACSLSPGAAKQQVVSEARNKHRKDDDMCWQFGVQLNLDDEFPPGVNEESFLQKES